MANEPLTLSIRAAARKLGQSRYWVQAQAEKGLIPAVRIGDRLLIKNALEALLEANTIQPPAAKPARGAVRDISHLMPAKRVFG